MMSVQKKLVAELGEIWKEMTEEQQAPFEEQAEGEDLLKGMIGFYGPG